MGLSEEIDEMVKGIKNVAPDEPSESTASAEPAPTEGGGDDVKPEEVPEGEVTGKEETGKDASTGASSKEEPSTGKETEEAPKEEDPRDVRLAQLEKDNEELRKSLDAQAAVPKEEPAPKETTKEVKDSFDDLDLDEIMSSKEKFKAFFKKYGEEIETKTTGAILRSLPMMVMKQSNYAAALRKSAEKFWGDNEDLKPVRNTVGRVINDLTAQNPDWTLEKIFAEAGPATRKLLKMKEKVEESSTAPEKKPTPAFASSTSKSTEKGAEHKKKKVVADEIDDLLNL